MLLQAAVMHRSRSVQDGGSHISVSVHTATTHVAAAAVASPAFQMFCTRSMKKLSIYAWVLLDIPLLCRSPVHSCHPRRVRLPEDVPVSASMTSFPAGRRTHISSASFSSAAGWLIFYLLFLSHDASSLYMGCGDVMISTISTVVSLRRHVVDKKHCLYMKFYIGLTIDSVYFCVILVVPSATVGRQGWIWVILSRLHCTTYTHNMAPVWRNTISALWSSPRILSWRTEVSGITNFKNIQSKLSLNINST